MLYTARDLAPQYDNRSRFFVVEKDIYTGNAVMIHKRGKIVVKLSSDMELDWQQKLAHSFLAYSDELTKSIQDLLASGHIRELDYKTHVVWNRLDPRFTANRSALEYGKTYYLVYVDPSRSKTQVNHYYGIIEFKVNYPGHDKELRSEHVEFVTHYYKGKASESTIRERVLERVRNADRSKIFDKLDDAITFHDQEFKRLMPFKPAHFVKFLIRDTGKSAKEWKEEGERFISRLSQEDKATLNYLISQGKQV